MKIRKARSSELGVILAMDRGFFADALGDLSGDNLLWVALDGVNLVGYIGAQLWEAPGHGEDALCLTRTGVIKSARGQGLQLRMLRAATSEAKRRGLDEVWGYTSHTNTHSMNNLIRAGFTTWEPLTWDGERRPWRPRPREDQGWVFWRKRVSS